MTRFDLRDLLRRSRSDEAAAVVARFRTEIDDPIRAFDHLEIVLDHDDRVAGVDQALKHLHQQRDIVEMQAGRRLVEDEKLAARDSPFSRDAMFAEMRDELEPLRFAAGQRIQRLAEPDVAEADFIEHVETVAEPLRFADLREELDRFADRQLEHVVNRFAVELHAQDVRLEAFAFAFRATHEEIAQELHLDLLEAGAATTLATAAAGVEGERARGQALRHRFRQSGEKLAHAIVEAEVKDRSRTRGARELRLIDHHDVADAMRAGDRFAGAGFLLGRLTFRAQRDSDRARRGSASICRNRRRRSRR